MDNLAKTFHLLELTRSQPQYGYALAGIRKNDLSDLAAHHYLVTAFAWLLARAAISAGAKIDMAKVLEFSLVHDLGELFGGDIAMPYARANPKGRRLAKAFEAENLRFMSRFFGGSAGYFKKISMEVQDAKTDESLIAKLADYFEVTHYKFYMRQLTSGDVIMVEKAMQKKLQKLKDKLAKQVLLELVDDWKKAILKLDFEIFEESKRKS